jgi:hypothetical protein
LLHPLAVFYNDCALDVLASEYPTLNITHAAPGIVNTNWGTEMPFFIRFFLRLLFPLIGQNKETLGNTLTESWLKAPPGFTLMSKTGDINTPKVTSIHESAKQEVAAGIKKVLSRF